MPPARKEEQQHDAQCRDEQITDTESSSVGSCALFARGGPIYVPDLVSPITTVIDFESTVIGELRSLDMELRDAEDFDDDLSVDELKVLDAQKLVEKALREDFNVLGSGGGIGSGDSQIDTLVSLCEANGGGGMEESREKPKRGNKRGRKFDRDTRGSALNGPYFSKVEELAKLLQKQSEDKVAARLHSFNGSCQLADNGVAATERTEKMQALRFITKPLEVKRPETIENIPVTYPEVVLSIEIYSWRETVKKMQEFMVLGRQRLTELRDQIYCLTDRLMEVAGQRGTSGYFLIEDLFCNDLRDPSSIDYSEPVLDWLRNKRSEAEQKWEYIISGGLNQKQKELLGNTSASCLPNLRATSMHTTRFCDLPFRLGSGYLYCHQGDCKHILVIRDMRMIHPEDEQNMAAYPLCTFQMKLRHRKCSVCDLRMAKKMTVDDKWTPHNPCYFCDNCYFLLHYSEDGKLLYDEFSVYDYYHE